MSHPLTASQHAPLVDLLFEHANVGLCLVCPQNRVLKANACWLGATGYTADQVIGEDIIGLFPQTRELALELHARARAGERVQVPRHCQRLGGRETWWEGSIDPVPMTGGTGLLLTVVNREHTDEQLRRGYETFHDLIQNDPFGVYVVDSDFRLRVVSLGAQKVFGSVRRPLLGRDFAEVLRIVWAEPFASEAIQRFRHTLHTGERYISPSTIEHRADIGEIEAYDWRIERITLPDGRHGVVCYFYDLSERQRWEAALRASEARFRALVKATSDMVYRMSADWSEMQVLEGQTLMADIASPKTNWLDDYVHPDDRPLVAQAIGEAMRARSVFELEHRVRRIDGTPGWTLSRAVPLLDAKGGITEWFGAATDVTARKEAESAVREALDRHAQQVRLFEGIASTTPDFVYIFDVQGRFLYANRRLLEVWGMELRAIVGKTCLELGYERWHHDMHMREIAQVIATRQPIKGEVPFTAPLTGVFGVYEYIFTPVLGPDGKIELIAGTTRDITHRKQAEEALKQADRAKDEFLATLAHELRNPLAPVRNAVEILNRPDIDEAERRLAQDIIARQVKHMVRLIDDLLEMSRITRGKLELRKEPIELRSVLDQALETSRPHVAHELTVALPGEPVLLHADAVRLAQVFSNLLNNACKFTPAGGRIALSAAHDADGIVVSVSDNGTGIAAEHLPHVFEMFSQAGLALERGGSGLGIGLALVRSLVEMHEGTVTAHSDGAGLGSEFRVRLPVLSASPAPAGDVPAGPRREPRVRRILIVEDQPDSAESLAMLLRLQGQEVALARDGATALHAAASFRPEAVLLDIGLPEQNGYEVCRAMRREPWSADALIIALTGWGQDQDRRKAMEAGFDGHLVKPMDYDALLELLSRLEEAPERLARP